MQWGWYVAGSVGCIERWVVDFPINLRSLASVCWVPTSQQFSIEMHYFLGFREILILACNGMCLATPLWSPDVLQKLKSDICLSRNAVWAGQSTPFSYGTWYPTKPLHWFHIIADAVHISLLVTYTTLNQNIIVSSSSMVTCASFQIQICDMRLYVVVYGVCGLSLCRAHASRMLDWLSQRQEGAALVRRD